MDRYAILAASSTSRRFRLRHLQDAKAILGATDNANVLVLKDSESLIGEVALTDLGQLTLRNFRAIPPSAAERLKQCRGIGIAIGLRLHEIDDRLLVRLLHT